LIKAIVFDLDDTLYDEMQFVKGGFKEVSLYVSRNYNINKNLIYNLLLEVLKNYGRGSTFDIALEKLDVNDEKLVPKLIDIYRKHTPHLSLYPQAKKILNILKKQKYGLGLITDGNSGVQKNKIKALNIEDYFNCIIFSDDYGIDKRKPSLFPYQKVIEKLNVNAKETIYIGDNPHKDFISAKKLGIHTVRILKGQYKDIKLENIYEANYQIKELTELFDLISQIKKLLRK